MARPRLAHASAADIAVPSGLYLVVNLSDDYSEPRDSAGVPDKEIFDVPYGAVKIGHSLNDIDKHVGQYHQDRYCNGLVYFEVLCRVADKEKLRSLDNEIEAVFKEHRVHRRSRGGIGKEWLQNVSADFVRGRALEVIDARLG